MLLLGVKPHKLDEVADTVATAIGPQTLVISILAGAEIDSLRARFPDAGAVIRAMPNTPVALGRGVVALFGEAGDRRADAEALMRPLGLTQWIEDKDQFAAVTALTGCGPAFLFRFISALADAGVALGLAQDQAVELAVATVDGAAGLAASSNETPEILADRVASPGGMTRKGLDVLDDDGILRELIFRTLDAALRRGEEMAAEAR